MKKTLTFATAILVASTVRAISFDWGINGDFTYFGSGNKVGGITATLVYLGEKTGGNTPAYSIDNWTVKNPTALTSSNGKATATSVTAPPALKGKLNSSTFDLAEGGQVGPSATDILTAGSSTFGLFLTYTDKDDVTWYNVSSSTYTIPAGSTDITLDLSTKYTFDWKVNDQGTALSAGGGWTAAAAVPEPGTAALALLGIGMLIKRRRA